MMQTQLVRLDKPYNFIMGKDYEKFAFHIATLLVITEREQSNSDTGKPTVGPTVKSYPVVGSRHGIDGEVWMDTELKDCLQLCREGETVSLYTLKEVMKYGAKNNMFLDGMPTRFSMALMFNDIKFTLPTDEKKQPIYDYEVELVFDEGGNDDIVMVYADKDSPFYFFEGFTNNPEVFSIAPTSLETIEDLADRRDEYLHALRIDGLRSITFTTKDKDYQWFVDKLNSYKADGDRI